MIISWRAADLPNPPIWTLAWYRRVVFDGLAERRLSELDVDEIHERHPWSQQFGRRGRHGEILIIRVHHYHTGEPDDHNRFDGDFMFVHAQARSEPQIGDLGRLAAIFSDATFLPPVRPVQRLLPYFGQPAFLALTAAAAPSEATTDDHRILDFDRNSETSGEAGDDDTDPDSLPGLVDVGEFQAPAQGIHLNALALEDRIHDMFDEGSATLTFLEWAYVEYTVACLLRRDIANHVTIANPSLKILLHIVMLLKAVGFTVVSYVDDLILQHPVDGRRIVVGLLQLGVTDVADFMTRITVANGDGLVLEQRFRHPTLAPLEDARATADALVSRWAPDDPEDEELHYTVEYINLPSEEEKARERVIRDKIQQSNHEYIDWARHPYSCVTDLFFNSIMPEEQLRLCRCMFKGFSLLGRARSTPNRRYH